MAEKIYWGKGQGCQFIDSSCTNHIEKNEEFCDKKFLGCSLSSFSTTKCYSTFFSNNCKMRKQHSTCLFPESFEQNFETYSPDSQCHYYRNYFGTTAGCIETKCDYQKMQYSIIQKNKTNPYEFLCEFEGQEHLILTSGATIICQDPKIICKKKLNCPANCNGRGICMDNNKCQCDSFYKGDLCGIFTGCLSSNESLCSDLMTANNVIPDSLPDNYLNALKEFEDSLEFYQGN